MSGPGGGMIAISGAVEFERVFDRQHSAFSLGDAAAPNYTSETNLAKEPRFAGSDEHAGRVFPHYRDPRLCGTGNPNEIPKTFGTN